MRGRPQLHDAAAPIVCSSCTSSGMKFPAIDMDHLGQSLFSFLSPDLVVHLEGPDRDLPLSGFVAEFEAAAKKSTLVSMIG